MSDITKIYQNVGNVLPKADSPSLPKETSGDKSFVDHLLADPAKKAIESAKAAEEAAILSTTGEMDELTVSEIVNTADVQLQEFKAVWEQFAKSLNELPRVSM